MNKLPITIDVEIPNDTDKIYDYTKHILDIIMEHLHLDLSHQRRIKLIIVELITNSIKHSNGLPTQFQLIIDHPQLSILKLENDLVRLSKFLLKILNRSYILVFRKAITTKYSL